MKRSSAAVYEALAKRHPRAATASAGAPAEMVLRLLILKQRGTELWRSGA